MDDNKTDFLIKLGGKRELKKALNELVKEQELLRIKIDELVAHAIQEQYGDKIDDPQFRATMSILHKMPRQHKVMFDTECEKSPYGMHGKANSHVLANTCIWCRHEFDYD